MDTMMDNPVDRAIEYYNDEGYEAYWRGESREAHGLASKDACSWLDGWDDANDVHWTRRRDPLRRMPGRNEGAKEETKP